MINRTNDGRCLIYLFFLIRNNIIEEIMNYLLVLHVSFCGVKELIRQFALFRCVYVEINSVAL